jgi:predicted small secreted protein
MERHRTALVMLIVLVALLLAGCAAGANPDVGVADAAGTLSGFWQGLWHGFISPVTFVISLFTERVNIYEIHNSGNWYDFGFVVGAGILFGGGPLGAKRAKG